GTTTKVTADTTVTGAMTVVIQWKDKAADSNDPVASETGYTVTENIADRILPWYTADTAIYYLAEGKPVTVKATLTAATALAYSGLLVDVNNVNGEFFRLRPDAALFTDHSGASWETQIANVTNVWTKGTVEEYIAMFADGASVVQVVKTSLENNVITHTVTSYAADDTEFENPVTITTYTITSTTDIHEVMIGVYMDGGVTVANAVAKYPTETNVTYNVTFDYNGGSPADIAVDGAANAVLNLRKDSGYTFGVDPVKTGYTFVGWTSSVEADALYRAEDTVTVTGEVTFTAQWTEAIYTQPAGSLLPDRVSAWADNTNAENGTIAGSANGYVLTANKATDWAYTFKYEHDSVLTVANNALYYDITIAGSAADQGDIVFYITNRMYFYLHEIIDTRAAGHYTGSITLDEINAILAEKYPADNSVEDRRFTPGETLTIIRVAPYIYDGGTLTIKELKVDESVQEQVAGSLLPNKASLITTRQNAEGVTIPDSTITGKDGGYEVKSNYTANWTFNDADTNVTINVATEGLYFDMTGSGAESAQFDIVLYDANGKYITLGTEWNTKYAMNGEHKGFISGASLLTLFKARYAENYTDSTTAITIKQVSLYLNKGCTLVVKELRTTDLYTVTYADGAEDEEITVPATVTVIAGGKYTVGAAIAREGYTFRGWLIGTTLHQPGEEITVTGNVTLTADWVAIGAHTVTYAGVEGVASTSHSPNATVTLPAAPAKTGYTFTGWEVKNGDETVTATETDGTYT
ncbi:MAG: InlB B-repeat-containing protein, partial [Clostridia bacterium]|nr:InlB B-repeat-containing protein [Clostridia bacterium]